MWPTTAVEGSCATQSMPDTAMAHARTDAHNPAMPREADVIDASTQCLTTSITMAVGVWSAY